jgi:hypothetical protein
MYAHVRLTFFGQKNLGGKKWCSFGPLPLYEPNLYLANLNEFPDCFGYIRDNSVNMYNSERRQQIKHMQQRKNALKEDTNRRDPNERNE